MTESRRGLLDDAAFFSESHAGTGELKLAYAYEQDLELAVLIGDPGLGKTALLRRFAARVEGAGDRLLDVFFPQLGPDELLAFLAGELDGEPTASTRREELLRRIASRVREAKEANRALAVVIDDAHLMADSATLETLHALLNLRERESAKITIVMAGQRSLIANLSRVPALAQRVGITTTLLPLSSAESAAYARQYLRSRGHGDVSIDDDALDGIHRLTGGVPRAINRLCEMAILVAASNGATELYLSDLRMVASELPRFGCEAA
jgi:type II secretory pathway predicted ATPase ExeA